MDMTRASAGQRRARPRDFGASDAVRPPTARASMHAMGEPWDPAAPGVLALPSGRLLRGRGLRRPLPAGSLPDFGVYLLGSEPPAVTWESRWLRWPDFGLPADRDQAASTLAEAWRRSAASRVEIACA